MNYFHFKDNWLGVWPGSREFNLYLEMIHLPTSSFFIHSIIISGLTHFLSQLFMEIWILLKLNFVIDKCMENFSVHTCVQKLSYIHTYIHTLFCNVLHLTALGNKSFPVVFPINNGVKLFCNSILILLKKNPYSDISTQ